MSVFVDTSVLVRYLTGDPPDMLPASLRIIEREKHLCVTEVCVAETLYVLESVYGVPRAAAIDGMMSLIRRRNISPAVLEKTELLSALLLCRSSHRVSPADAIQWAWARHSGRPPAEQAVIYTFDKRFPNDSIELRDDYYEQT